MKTLVIAIALISASIFAHANLAPTPVEPAVGFQQPWLMYAVSVSSNVSAIGYNQIVAPSGTLKFALLQYNITCPVAVTAAFAQSDSLLADLITSSKTIATNGQIISPASPYAIAISSAGAGLGINLSAAGACGVDLTYAIKNN